MTMTFVDVASVVSGPAIRLTRDEELNQYRPDWPEDTPSNLIENWTYDENDPMHCKVYPPADTDAFVEIVVVKEPVPVTGVLSVCDLDDQYFEAHRLGVLAIALEKDLENPLPDRAAWYRKAFYDTLGIADSEDAKNSPNLLDQGGVPARSLGVKS